MHLGIDIGGTNLKAGIVGEKGVIIKQASEPTNAGQGFDSVFKRLAEIAKTLIIEFPETQSIGIGFPGVISTDGTILVAPNMPGADNFKLVDEFKKSFALPTSADNDANAAAIAELELGAGYGESHFLYVTLGTGIGGAIVANGDVFKGNSGGAGELGHIFIDWKRCVSGALSYRSGIFEEAASRQGIIDCAKRFSQHCKETALSSIPALDVDDISKACAQGDKAARDCFIEIGRIIGIGLASAMNLLDIDIVVAGGGISQAHPLLFDTALDTIRTCALPHIAGKAELRKAHFGANAGIIGAAILGKRSLKVF